MASPLTLEWADGSYDFKLTWLGCAEVEKKADGPGIQEIYERVMLGQSHLSDVVEIIRQGLRGGGGGIVDEQAVQMNDALMNDLVKRYVTGDEAAPFVESWNLATVILHTFVVGHDSAADAPKKKAEEPAGSTPPKS